MNVINFPICRHGKDGLHWYGGRGFNTKQKVIDTMSDKDWRRIVQWESHHAARKLLTEREPPQPPRRRADIAAQGECLAVLQRAGHVMHVGRSGT